jgi:hypothetical protein
VPFLEVVFVIAALIITMVLEHTMNTGSEATVGGMDIEESFHS